MMNFQELVMKTGSDEKEDDAVIHLDMKTEGERGWGESQQVQPTEMTAHSGRQERILIFGLAGLDCSEIWLVARHLELANHEENGSYQVSYTKQEQ